jgi:hypothetical protein
MKYLSTLLVAAALVMLGCKTADRAKPGASKSEESPKNKDLFLPMIYSIGNGAVLTFKRGSGLSIPIDGQNLSDKQYDLAVFVKGVYPLSFEQDFTVDRTNRNNQAMLRIKPSYFTEGIKSRDTLSVEVRISRKSKADYQKVLEEVKNVEDDSTLGEDLKKIRYRNMASQMSLEGFEDTSRASHDLVTELKKQIKELQLEAGKYGESISTASRIFVLYEASDFREKFLSTRVDVPDINAFPIPEQETKKLFGSFVAENFYVVKLSIRNTKDDDVLVSTGLIKAYGRALVRPTGDRGSLSFTVPIEVAPQSREHVYAMVQAQRDFKTRQWIFRSLDFAGALAGAITVGYGGPGAIKATELATSVGVPGLRALWPDTVPNQLQNIVNFAMSDLVKVPKKTVSLHKYLFFSKGELEAVIPDPLMLGERSFLARKGNNVPAGIAYLSFDTLEIPYENVVVGPQDSTERRLSRLLMRNQELRQRVFTFKDSWVTPAPADARLYAASRYDINTMISNLDAAKAVLDGRTTTPEVGEAKTNVTTLRSLLAQALPGNVSTTFLGSPEFGELALTSMNAELERVRSALLTGSNGSLFDDQLRAIEDRYNTSDAAFEFLKEVAGVAKNKETADAINDLTISGDPSTIHSGTKVLNNQILSLMRIPETSFLYPRVNAPSKIE